MGASVSQGREHVRGAETRRLTRARAAAEPSAQDGVPPGEPVQHAGGGSASVRPPPRRPEGWAVLRALLRGGAQSPVPWACRRGPSGLLAPGPAG